VPQHCSEEDKGHVSLASSIAVQDSCFSQNARHISQSTTTLHRLLSITPIVSRTMDAHRDLTFAVYLPINIRSRRLLPDNTYYCNSQRYLTSRTDLPSLLVPNQVDHHDSCYLPALLAHSRSLIRNTLPQ
jgi:hypothetical protein